MRMTKQDAIRILKTTWEIIKVVSIFAYKYGSIALKWLWKTFVSILPTLVYFVMCFIGGMVGGATDAASQKTAPAPGRAPYRVWDSSENTSYYHKR